MFVVRTIGGNRLTGADNDAGDSFSLSLNSGQFSRDFLEVIARLHKSRDLFQRILGGQGPVCFNKVCLVGKHIVPDHLAEPIGKIPGIHVFAKGEVRKLR